MAEKRRFLDRVLRFMGIEDVTATAEDTAETEPEAPPAEVPEAALERRSYRQSGTPSAAAPAEPRVRVRVRPVHMEPQRFNDVQAVADRLISREPVVISIEGLDKETARRVLDFLGGTTYALGGHIQKVQEHTYLLAPGGVEVDTSTAAFARDRAEERMQDARRDAAW